MKFHYPYPFVMNIFPPNEDRHYHSIGIIALTPDKDLICVREIQHKELWESYWKHVGNDLPGEKYHPKDDITDHTKNISAISWIITDALHYIIAKGYLFFGILYLDKEVLDPGILKESMIFRFKNRHFENMQKTYRENRRYPRILEKSALDAVFIGTGERFISQENENFAQIAQTTKFFKGSLCGIMGVPSDSLQFVILSQNITRENTLGELKLDRNGKGTLGNLIKFKQFSPAGGFKFDFGLWALRMIPEWGSIELLPQFKQGYENYTQYMQYLISGKPNPFEFPPNLYIFNEKILIKLKAEDKPKLTVDTLIKGSSAVALPAKSEVPQPSTIDNRVTSALQQQATPQMEAAKPLEKVAIPPSAAGKPLEKPAIPAAAKPLEKPAIPLPAVKPLEKLAIPLPATAKSLQKPDLASIPSHPLDENEGIIEDIDAPITDEENEEGYDDIFKDKEVQIFDKEGNLVMDPSKLDDKFLQSAASSLDADMGKAINPSLMNQNDIFTDLESSLEAMSKLDDLAKKDEAVSRIFYPPPTLISFANKEGMQIGGSLCMISMGVGGNMWMVPELKRMQMWGKFYKDLEGNPQIEDFVAMEEKDIESAEALENILQVSFNKIRKDNLLFIGTVEIEGNGFERNVFDQCEMTEENIQKLMDIHIQRRQNVTFPELSKDSWIEVHYYGREDVINFIASTKSKGILEIAADVQSDPRYSQGLLGGIICVDMEAAYFFILTNNFENLEVNDDKFPIDQTTLNKMYEMINTAMLTPVSWFVIRFGFKSFESLFLWDEIKEGAVIPGMRELYDFYVNKLLQTKAREDSLRHQAESEFPELSPVICPKCGEKNPPVTTFCVACGQKLE